MVASILFVGALALQYHHPARSPSSTPRSLLVAANAKMPLSFIQQRWALYLHLLEEKPMATKMATSAFLSGSGDLIAQAMDASSVFSARRFLVQVSANVLYIVPILTIFYAANEALIKKLKTPPGWQRTGVQLAFDQLINAPIVVAGFFCAFQLFSAIADTLSMGTPFAFGSIARAARTQLAASWWSTVIANWKVWVLPQLFNFAVVPPFARVAFANLVGLVWSIILSVIANGA